jgi:hypothetical protein
MPAKNGRRIFPASLRSRISQSVAIKLSVEKGRPEGRPFSVVEFLMLSDSMEIFSEEFPGPTENSADPGFFPFTAASAFR